MAADRLFWMRSLGKKKKKKKQRRRRQRRRSHEVNNTRDEAPVGPGKRQYHSAAPPLLGPSATAVIGRAERG